MEDKLLLFLIKEVMNRPLRLRSQKADGDVLLLKTQLT